MATAAGPELPGPPPSWTGARVLVLQLTSRVREAPLTVAAATAALLRALTCRRMHSRGPEFGDIRAGH